MIVAARPLVSIAMAARNASRHIAEALSSIETALGHSGIPYEVTLADGGSADNTRELALAFRNVRLVSTSDSGIYDGMNRAISAAQGEMLILLNSDDMLEAAALALAVEVLAQHPSAAMVSGSVLTGTVRHDAVELKNRGPLSIEGLLFGIPAINARLIRTAALKAAGPIASELGLGADREILARLLRNGERGIAVNKPIYFYRSHAGSATIANDEAARNRIYQSDDTLIRYMRAAYAIDSRHEAALRAFDALSGLKHKRAGLSRIPYPAPHATNSLDLARGVWLNRMWRGRLSGY